MNELRLIKDFNSEFRAGDIDKKHIHERELLMGPFEPKIVFIGEDAVGCVDLRWNRMQMIEGFVELAYIYMYKPRLGYGSKILMKICELADFYKLEIKLDAVPIKGFDVSISRDSLHSFYRKFGFKIAVPGSNMMTRMPNP